MDKREGVEVGAIHVLGVATGGRLVARKKASIQSAITTLLYQILLYKVANKHVPHIIYIMCYSRCGFSFKVYISRIVLQ